MPTIAKIEYQSPVVLDYYDENGRNLLHFKRGEEQGHRYKIGDEIDG